MNSAVPNSALRSRDELQRLAARERASFERATPFPHVVIDDFADVEVLQRIIEEFPTLTAGGGQALEQNKVTLSDDESLGPQTRSLIHELNSAPAIEFLEELTGIDGLIPDPHLLGGGLHAVGRGGFLKIHADFNRHPRLNLDRRLNLILYLNADWREEYGGALELWDESLSRCERSILPLFNRCVVFETTDVSYHGHPDPMPSPENVPRRSIALYYYTNGRPRGQTSAAHTTLFKARPGEQLQRPPSYVAKVVAQKILPPIIADAVRKASLRRAGRSRSQAGPD